ncbi:MAG TPA: twin-arginine translocase TatA/TatE family subunit [Saprospiraceae bacterium]|nr:twin-arginine translocase TatA/TatE family subunit [Saprospiraceae bacterium]
MENLMFAFIPGGWEFMAIVFVVLLLFGGKKIPELARGVGKGIREFNSARATIENEIKEGIREADKKIEGKKED